MWRKKDRQSFTSCLTLFISRTVSPMRNSMLPLPFSALVSLLEMSPGKFWGNNIAEFDAIGMSLAVLTLPSSNASLWPCSTSFWRKSVVSLTVVSIFDIASETSLFDPLVQSSAPLPTHAADAPTTCFTCFSRRRTKFSSRFRWNTEHIWLCFFASEYLIFYRKEWLL